MPNKCPLRKLCSLSDPSKLGNKINRAGHTLFVATLI